MVTYKPPKPYNPKPGKRKAGHGRAECSERDADCRFCDGPALECWDYNGGEKRMAEIRRLIAKADADLEAYERAALDILENATCLIPETLTAFQNSWERHILRYRGKELIAEAQASHESRVQTARAAIMKVNRAKLEHYDKMLKTPRSPEFHCRVVFENVMLQGSRCLCELSETVDKTRHINAAFFVVPTLVVTFVDGHFVLRQE